MMSTVPPHSEMWLFERLIQLLVDRYLPDRRELREQPARKKIVFLLEALVDCHNAYMAYSSDKDELRLIAWRLSVENLVRTLDSLRTTLASIWPETFDAVYDYSIIERVESEYSEDPVTDQTDKEEVARLLQEMTVLRTSMVDRPKLGDIHTAISKLKEAISERMSEGEIHSAVREYRAGKRAKALDLLLDT